MRKILISLAIAVTTISIVPTAFAQESAASNPTVELVFWNSVKDSRDPNELQAYLNKYPKGQFSELAAIRKQSLEKLKTGSISGDGNAKNQSSRVGNSDTNSTPPRIDPKFDRYIAEVKSLVGPRGAIDIRIALPVLLPVSPENMKKVHAMANLFFEAPFPSAGAISIGSTGAVSMGTSVPSFTVLPDVLALSDCESKRKNFENILPNCAIFFRSRKIDSRVLFDVLDHARGPDFDAWVAGMNDSIATLRVRPPTVVR